MHVVPSPPLLEPPLLELLDAPLLPLEPPSPTAALHAMNDAAHAVSLPANTAPVHASCWYVSVSIGQHPARSSHDEADGGGSEDGAEDGAGVVEVPVDEGAGALLVLEDGDGVVVVAFFDGAAVWLLSSFVSS